MIMSAQSHLVHQFDEDLDELKHLLYSMGDLVVEQINNATKAFRTADIDLAQSVKDRDAAINALEVSTDRCATLLIAKHQPAATDLRFVFGIAKMATDFERMGDQARNIARASRGDIPEKLSEELAKVGIVEATVKTVNLAMLALKNLSETAAVNTLRSDGDVDEAFKAGIKTVTLYLKEHPEDVEKALACLDLLKAYERLGDHATNIAEHVIFILDGEDIRHLRLDALPENLAIQAVLRRYRYHTQSDEKSKNVEIVCGPLVMNEASFEAKVDGQPLTLSAKEFKLLLVFAKNHERVYSREMLLSLVWDNAYVDERTVDVHMLRLRKQLQGTRAENLLQTVRGLGYRAHISN